MNIVVRTFKGNIIIRPDTTWVRKDEDFYVPDFVSSLSMSKVICARICRPGKCVSVRFAERYYDTVGTGLLLYPDNLIVGSEESYASAICLGHSSYIKMPESEKSIFSESERALICEAISSATQLCLIRTGDIIAVEITERTYLCSRDDGRFSMPNFDIIF